MRDGGLGELAASVAGTGMAKSGLIRHFMPTLDRRKMEKQGGGLAPMQEAAE